MHEGEQGDQGAPPAGGDDGAGAGAPPAGDGGVAERPEWIPEGMWDPAGKLTDEALGRLTRAGVPDTPDGYALPEIDGLDREQAGKSPVVAAMRAAAHKAGMAPEAFSEAMTQYVTLSLAAEEEAYTAEMAALGEGAKERINRLNSALGASLPAELASALAASATSAASVKAIEKLLESGGRQAPAGDQTNTPPRKSKAEIEAVMNTPEYYDHRKRNAAIVAEVDKWFEDEAAQKRKAAVQ
jgi:hypothetical protein